MFNTSFPSVLWDGGYRSELPLVRSKKWKPPCPLHLETIYINDIAIAFLSKLGEKGSLSFFGLYPLLASLQRTGDNQEQRSNTRRKIYSESVTKEKILYQSLSFYTYRTKTVMLVGTLWGHNRGASTTKEQGYRQITILPESSI